MMIGTGVRNKPPDVSARTQCHREVVSECRQHFTRVPRCENYIHGALKVLEIAIKKGQGMGRECCKETLSPRSIEFFTHHPDAVWMIIFPPNPIINMNDHRWHRQDDLKKIALKNS